MDDVILAVFLLLPPLFAGALRIFFRLPAARRGGAIALGAGNALVLLLLLSVLILGGECYYRFGYDATDSFGLTKTTQRWLERHFHRNARGFRDNVPDYADRIAPGKRRVTFIGDSFTAGHGIREVRNRFPNIIRRRKPEWEVHVGANLGTDTPDHLALLRRAAASPYEFDWVVLVYNLNDIASVMPTWREVFERIYEREEPFLVRDSWFFNVVYHRIRARLDPDVSAFFRFTRDGYSGPAWDTQRRLLREMKQVVASRGGNFAVLTFPFIRAVSPASPLRRIHAMLDDFWTGLGVPHLDLLPALEGIPRWRLVVNRHDAHPNAYAHAVVAKVVEPFLEELVESAPPIGASGRGPGADAEAGGGLTP